ncbi:MAG: Rpn family recombination-promoting nuclease/putative transposase [Oscillospiraceae bacterium]|nr:Rpn family recombination-promoting nuclease/putative transposase [Oscillospiraceae bacterium]
MSDAIVRVPEILPVKDDLVFKRLLTHADAQPVLRLVTSGLLKANVREVTIRNTELPKESPDDKNERFDVNCRTDTGDQVAIEMQAAAMDGDNKETGHRMIKARATFGVCDLYASQRGKGVEYGKMLGAYQTTFLGYSVFDRNDRYVHRFLFRDEDGETLADDVGIIFIELTKIGALLDKEAKKMTRLEAFVTFMVIADNPGKTDKLRELIKEWEEIGVAYELLTTMSKDENERALFRSRMMAQMDRDSQFSAVMNEGIKLGRAEGRTEGRVEGRTEGEMLGAQRAARIMFRHGIPIIDIASEYGRPTQEIEQWVKAQK